MAEGLLRKEAGDIFDVYSAGTSPKGIHPLTVRVMNAIGIDVSGQRSKHLSEYLGKLLVKHLIIVCDQASRECPTTWPGASSRLVWLFDDPAACQGTDEERLAKFRAIRDQIQARIRDWLPSVRKA